MRAARVAVVGLGGVGSWAAEALARSGVAGLVLIDLDHVAESNVNRQVQALDRRSAWRRRPRWPGASPTSTPAARSTRSRSSSTPPTGRRCCRGRSTRVIDACDQVRAKRPSPPGRWPPARRWSSSARPAASELPQAVEVGDLAQVTHDPLLAALRQRLRQAGAMPRGGAPAGVRCVFSREPVRAPQRRRRRVRRRRQPQLPRLRLERRRHRDLRHGRRRRGAAPGACRRVAARPRYNSRACRVVSSVGRAADF